MAFTLTLLGTDTSFSPKATTGYDKAETLSYVSTLINETSTGSVDDVVQFRNDQVAVINGPTTSGSEIGDRIARGVTIILEAISRGEQNISIIAHSRGAVEAILVAHELERIQKILQESREFKPELNNSECSYTKKALTTEPHQRTFENLAWDKIGRNITDVKLSMLNIDPVPGGNYIGLTYTTTLAWRDPRFYKLPKIVSEYEQYIYENERTRCFKPIVPKCVSEETKFKLTSLPGHHGTGSGNLHDQQLRVNPEQADTSHVQELCLIKLMDFLSRNGVILKRKASDTDPFHPLMERFFAESPEKDKKLKQIYLELFDNIVKNRAGYDHYNNTAYATLGQEQSIQKWIWNTKNQRIVHFEEHNDTFLEEIIHPVPGRKFLNFEHARLYINKELGLSDTVHLSKTINKAVENLLKLCNQYRTKQDLKKTDDADLTESTINRGRLIPALETEEGFTLLLECLSTLIDEVRQSYLQNKIVDSEEQNALYTAISNSFKSFKKYTNENKENELAKAIFAQFKADLKNTLDFKRDKLMARNEMLTKIMQDKKPLQGFQDNIQKVINKIRSKEPAPNEAESLLVNNLNKLINKIQTTDFTETESIKQFLESECLIFQEMNIANGEGNELVIESRNCVLAFFMEAAEDNQFYKIEDIIPEVINLANELEQYKGTIPNFKAFDSSYDYKALEKTLTQQLDQLINLTGKYIAEQEIPLDSIDNLFKDENNFNLYKRIKYNAIGRGAVDPLALALKKKLALAEKEQHLLTAELTKGKEEQAKLISDFNSREEELKKLNKELSLAKEQTNNKVQNLTQQVADLNIKLTKLKSQQNAATDALDNNTEFEFEKIIISKLYPLTNNYLLSLAQEVKNKIDSNLDITDYSKLISNIRLIKTWPTDEGSQILNEKILVLCDLQDILTSKKPASERVKSFYAELNEANTTLANHRDPDWIRFTKNAAIVLSIILTGILPGLFVLGVITLTGSSPKFWQSSGQTFFQKASQQITNYNAFLNHIEISAKDNRNFDRER